ncbi:hypothetical protein L207DRAFT_576524 [Hyaloscypha variabilis F]|uniref:PH domain-containing protein n=1 Tax=Hyaloscypha variabilis (strain UAMH 11265 / GT02V1 / F) TaxID=1149755 RepID=A0A2J6SAG1_HYAVF|nr:hypothetical protein L207DRAFT_576524 [Hyaloscypha variabilis F]
MEFEGPTGPLSAIPRAFVSARPPPCSSFMHPLLWHWHASSSRPRSISVLSASGKLSLSTGVTREGRIDLWVEIGIRGDEISGAVNMNWEADWVGWPHEPSRVLGIEDIITISSPSKEDRAESRTCHLTYAYTGFLSLCYTLSIVFDSVEDADLWVQTIEALHRVDRLIRAPSTVYSLWDGI